MNYGLAMPFLGILPFKRKIEEKTHSLAWKDMSGGCGGCEFTSQVLSRWADLIFQS